MSYTEIFFYIFAVLSILFALLTVTRRNAVHAAICLLLTFFFIACNYVLLEAEFLAAVQVLVYAGGVVGLMLYVIMLVRKDEADEVRQSLGQRVIAVFIAILFVLEIAFISLLAYYGNYSGFLSSKMAQIGGNTESIGAVLYTYFLLPFEVVSVLLLAALVGAVVLAKNRIER
ncbi:MAG: NADH-quinone oxidoreductase subunit J [Thermosulfidibacteraceae bacterium]|jgi:NADH-quinone oxidoreductase subunit J